MIFYFWSRHAFLSILLLLPITATADLPLLQHEMRVEFNIENRLFQAQDRIVIHHGSGVAASQLPDFSLNPRWRVTSLSFNGKPHATQAQMQNGHIVVPTGTTELNIVYGGEVDESQWPYIVWLPGDGWYPEAEDHFVRFKLTLDAPRGWQALSQGVPSDLSANPQHSWFQSDPQQGIYLVVGPWHHYAAHNAAYRTGAMLIEQDESLAGRYLDAARKHLAIYSQALGSYPYHGFTLVENRRQTGWGMPAFTLLGSKVIRLPFILDTSFPHEILHNWWGNGVFVNPVTGNWSEGLTTYLSDYLARERRGEGRQYRLDTLISWQDFAARSADFPLSRFVGRHDRATQAVGYGKGMFLFHMLRNELGDALFLAGLRHFYARFRFKQASFADVQRAFEQVCTCSLEAFFLQWLTRRGAPVLRLDSALPEALGNGHSLRIGISQPGEGEPWNLRVPVRIIDIAGNVAMQSVQLSAATASFDIELDAPAARVDLDPEIALFRTLDESEKPTTFSKVFAARQASIVAADDSFLQAARAIAGLKPGWRVSTGNADELGTADVVVLLGREHAASSWFGSSEHDRYAIKQDDMVLQGVTYPLGAHSVIALVDTVNIEQARKTVLWIASRQSAGLPDLMRRLSHYGRFSYAVFNDVENRATSTGQWQGEATSLSRVFDVSVPVPDAAPSIPLF